MHETYQHHILKEADFTLNAILDTIIEGTWDWNAITGHVNRSLGWYKMLGYDVGIFVEDVFTWENIIHPDDYKMVMECFELYINKKADKYEVEYRCKTSSGKYIWIIDRGKAVSTKEDGSVERMIGAHENINDRKIAQIELIKRNQLLQEGNLTLEKLLEEKNRLLEIRNIELELKIKEIELLSTTDLLTQIPNRRKFEEIIELDIARSNRYGHKLSLIICDIDFFKKVNDQYGHKIGDKVLSVLASFMQKHLRVNDNISRWGGEEFAILLPDTNIDDAYEVAKKFNKEIEKIEFENSLFITCSFGVATYMINETKDDFFSRADSALYKAKELGRNRVEIMNEILNKI